MLSSANMPNDEADFALLSEAWTDLQRRRLRRWDATLSAMVAEQDALRAQGRWRAGPADLLSIIGHARYELHHCAMLAWLLNPRAPHGLGLAFLERVLLRCCPELRLGRDLLQAATVDREVVRKHGRADLLVSVGNRLTLVVEVKVDHVERERQCDDLYADFHHDPGARFALLTPHGRAPVSASGAALRAFRRLSFRQVRADLRACLATIDLQSASLVAAGTLHCYLHTLDQEFP